MSLAIEEEIAAVARRQYGLITRAQLLEIGLPRGAIRRRVGSGRLRRLHRGVYLVGPILPDGGKEMAAVLACGRAAVLSHRSAASLWGLIPPADAGREVDVTVCGRFNGDRQGIRVRRVGALEADERAILRSIPTTAPGRTLVDLASMVGAKDLERAVARAEREGLIEARTFPALMDRYKGRPGIPVLRAVLAKEGGPLLTRSEAEARFLILLRKARLPVPETNVTIGGFEIDFLWRAEASRWKWMVTGTTPRAPASKATGAAPRASPPKESRRFR